MSEWTEVLLTYDDIEAYLVKDILEAENVQVIINSMKITPFPVSFGRLGEIRIMVKKDELALAKKILNIMKNAEGDLEE